MWNDKNELDIVRGLFESEKKLMNYFNRIEIRGKSCSLYQMVQTIKCLVEMCHSMVPPIDSPNDFQLELEYGHIILEFAKEVDVSDLTMFTFTHLRKQTATLSQYMDISMETGSTSKIPRP